MPLTPAVSDLVGSGTAPGADSPDLRVDCPYCGATSCRTIVAAPRVVACTECGFYRAWPRMDRQAQVAYIEAVNARTDVVHWRRPADGLPGLAWELDFLRRWLPHVFSGGRVLDVGTAEGTFVTGLAQAGARAVGLEPIASLAAHARSHGLDVRTARFEPGGLPPDLLDEPFDLVCFRECWYYLPDLPEAFALLRRLLAPDGAVYVKAAQGRSLCFRFRPDYLSRYNPSVAGIPTPTAMRNIFIREGFVIRYLGEYPEHVLMTLGLSRTVPTRLLSRIVDPLARPLVRRAGRHDRLVLLAVRAPAESCHA